MSQIHVMLHIHVHTINSNKYNDINILHVHVECFVLIHKHANDQTTFHLFDVGDIATFVNISIFNNW